MTPQRLDNAVFQGVQEEMEIVWNTQNIVSAIIIQQREEKWCVVGEGTSILGFIECPSSAQVKAWKDTVSSRHAEFEGGRGVGGVWWEIDIENGKMRD